MAEDTRRDWEVVQEDVGVSRTDRLHIGSGWLYRTVILEHDALVAVALVFVPLT